MLEFHGLRWGITYLVTDGRLTEENRRYLLGEATEMYLRNEEKREIKTDSLEGRIFTEGKCWSIGGCSGQQFDAEVEAGFGRARIRVLVQERTGYTQNRLEYNN